jgi:hypothetical protein
MRRHPAFQTMWRFVNASVILLTLLLPIAAVWEFSTRQYLQGFAAGILPPSSSPEKKVTAIVAWMARDSVQPGASSTDLLTVRDPEQTLTSGKLLSICGSATNAFVNLANVSGVPARRLLLLNEGGTANHVVAEVFVGDSWRVVDPVFHTIPRAADGHWLSASDLHDPVMLALVTQNIPAYRPDYNYQRTAHLRLGRVPVLGPLGGKILDRLRPGWDATVLWTLLVERESFAAFAGVVFLLCVFLALRQMMKIYGLLRLEISRSELAWWPWPLHAVRNSSKAP